MALDVGDILIVTSAAYAIGLAAGFAATVFGAFIARRF
jgi:hypothetical protein